ncbi:MAG: 50S ribosomal protein L11 methyltransferase [Deltaproteobacteria bacterium]|nr:50S ribosomal protein L11 methyltransferase [Deltaproteobacteria bacterium]
MKRWLALSLLIPKELAEPISNFLMEQGATGIEEVEEDLERERLKAYFLQDGGEQRALRSLRRHLKSLQEINLKLPHSKIETASIPDQDWGENWKRFFKPLRVGSRFVVKPPWARIRLIKDEIPIEINPGMAFGTGTHATTRLCMEALEKRLKKGFSVLDVGTGSGILSIAAAQLGSGEVLGIDIDQLAVEIAKENVSRNQVSDRVRIKKGSIGDIRKRFDLVVANLDFRSLRKIRMALVRHIKRQGFLILSGVLDTEEERLRQHYIETKLLQWVETDPEGEWVCLTFRKR